MKKILLFLLICILGYVTYIVYTTKEEEKENQILKNTEQKYAVINNYFIYGQSLNIEGNLKLEDNCKSIYLLFKSANNELEYKLQYENSKFKISEEINNGINLDKIKKGNYYILIKTIDKEDNIKYYSIDNQSKYTNNEYYTITKNNQNNKILINFSESKLKETSKKYMMIKVKKTKLPNNIYDIVIDSGHGGKDSGALSLDEKYYEKDITLDYGKDLKIALEQLGLKVKLTRDGSNEDELGIYDAYGKNGRAVIPNKVKAKYTLSLHLNSLPYKLKHGGVEIYSPTRSNLEFAKKLALNIVEYANTNYSNAEIFKEAEGVYVRYFTDEDIRLNDVSASNNGYEPYNIDKNTPYYFIIRETGGIATNAYMDGRNKNYGKNIYYDYNYGSETYLLELGYIVCDNDLYNILNNKDGYVRGITEAVKSHLILEKN